MARAMAAFVFYGKVSYNQELATVNDKDFDLLSMVALGVFWGALWLELWPLLCYMVECHRIRSWRHETIESSISYRLVSSMSSGMPCGSSYSRFCVSL